MEAGTLSSLSTGISAVGAGVRGFSQIEQGSALETSGRARQLGYDYNAQLAVEKAKYEAELSAEKFERLKGKQTALYAKAGVDIGSGSPLLVVADTASQEKEEMSMIMQGGLSQAAIDRFYGGISRYEGDVAKRGATMTGMTTFLTGLGQAGAQYARRNAPLNYGA
jgi:hypothetical protein